MFSTAQTEEPIRNLNSLPFELIDARETAKLGLYKVGTLSLAREELKAKMAETGSDPKTLRKLAALHRASVTGDQDWVDYAMDELRDMLGKHVAAEFVSINLIERQADKICLAMCMVNEYMQIEKPTPGQRAEMKTAQDTLQPLKKGLVNLLSAFSGKGPKVCELAVNGYTMQVAKALSQQAETVGLR